jgi:predicted PurR-regulated permease PerM
MLNRLPWPLVFQVLGVVAAVWLVVHTWQLWLLGFTALILAAAMLPAAHLGERYRVPRGVTVLGIYVLAVGVFMLMGRLLWPALKEQWRNFVENVPRLLENIRTWLGTLDMLGWILNGSVSIPKPENVQALAGSMLANTLQATAGVVGFFIGLLAVLVIAAYIVIDAEHIGAVLLRLLPVRHRPQARDLAGPVLIRVGGYVRGQMLSSLCVGALLAIALWLLGVRYALLLGAVAAVLNVVPFVGSLVAAVLGVLSALNESVSLAVGAAAIFWGVNVLEGKFLAPQFVGRATGLHPLAVLLALLAGAHLAGLIGALVAVPLVAGLWEIARRLWVERQGP